MATNARFEWVRLRNKTSNGLQDMWDIGNVAAVQKALTGTALTGAGRVTVPGSVNGYTKFHLRYQATVESIISFAPAGDAGTSFDATATVAGGVQVPANTPVLIPVTPGMLISAGTGITYA